MSYSIKFRKRLFWRKVKGLIGHQFNPELMRMDFYLEDGSIISIPEWHKYELKLGADWVLWTKKQMEQQSGQTINLNIKGDK